MPRKLTNKYDVVQMGDTPGFWDSMSKRVDQYLDPELQMKLRAEKEEKRRYNKQQSDLIAQKNFESDVSAWEDDESDYNMMISNAKNPSQIKIINKYWEDRDKTYKIRNIDGTVEEKSLSIGVYNDIANEELGRKNTHTVLRDEYMNHETTRERRMEIYSQVKQTGLDAGMALDSSIDATNKEDKQYESNRQLVDYITSADYLKGTGIPVEDAESLKERLTSGGISDAELGILNDFVTKRTQSKRKTREFWEKLYNKSLETYGDTKLETPTGVRQKLRKLMDMAEKELGIVSEQGGNQGDLGGGNIMDLESLTPEQRNIFENTIRNQAGGDEAFNNLSDEEAVKLSKEVYASMFPSIPNRKTPPVNQTAKDSGDFFDLTNIQTRSKQYVIDTINNEDDLQIRNKKGKITNPFDAERRKLKVLKDPISGKSVNRDTLLNNMKNNPIKYASKGYVYDPNHVIGWVDTEVGFGKDPKRKTFIIGYRKMSPKLALQTLNKGQSIPFNQPQRLEIE